MRVFAEDTKVSVEKSRSEITSFLREWQADSMSWEDDWATGAATLRFTWAYDNARITARMEVVPDSLEELGKLQPPTSRAAPAVYARRAQEQQQRQLHRLLALMLKGQLNAVRAGMITAFEVFLPFLETAEGRRGPSIGAIARKNIVAFLTVAGGGPRQITEGEP